MTESKSSFSFKPSKLSDLTEKLWEKSKSELKNTISAEGDTPTLGLTLFSGKNRSQDDSKKLFGDLSVPDKADDSKPAFVFGAKIAERVTVRLDFVWILV